MINSVLILSADLRATSLIRTVKRIKYRLCVYQFALATIVALAVIATPFSHAQTLTLLHSFTGNSGDGSTPQYGSLVRDSSGNLYGTTEIGGTTGLGVVFKTTSSGTTTVLHTFTGSGGDGSKPYGGLVLDSSSNLYGTTEQGGTSGLGIVFKVSTSGGTLTVLHTFTGSGGDGSQPVGALVLDSSSNLYGTTVAGGTSGNGTVFKVSTTGGTLTVLHSFAGSPDGSAPYGALVRDSSGNLYGTTTQGGSSGLGIVFKTTSSGTTTTLHTFTGSGGDGSKPFGGLALDSSGNLYGTTEQGGTSGLGVIFKTTSSGTTTTLHAFTGSGGDGSNPLGGLIVDSSGNLYGTTEQGGTTGLGTVFKRTSSGTTSTLHTFAGGSGDGSMPYGGLVRDSSGILYGTTTQGGTSGLGTVYKLQ